MQPRHAEGEGAKRTSPREDLIASLFVGMHKMRPLLSYPVIAVVVDRSRDGNDST